jgi:hypothetical protein
MSQQIFDKISFQYLEFICKDFKWLATMNIKLFFLVEAIAVKKFLIFWFCLNYFYSEFLIMKMKIILLNTDFSFWIHSNFYKIHMLNRSKIYKVFTMKTLRAEEGMSFLLININ